METIAAPDQAALEYFEAKLRYETTPHTLKHNLDHGKVFLIDGRERADHEAERIPGAVSIPLGELERRIAEVPRDKTVVAYGWHMVCAIGTKACVILARHGLRAQELAGGLERWKLKFPTEGSQAK